jgi:hypothetical protein
VRIYVDLDDTLVTSEIDPYTGAVRRIFPRPDAHEFLANLSRHGSIRILTRAGSVHAERAVRKLGTAAKFVKGVITREDMAAVEDKIEAILTAPISDESKNVLLSKVKPLYPKGVIFDNDEAWSDTFLLKTTAVGVGFDEWIKVDPFDLDVQDLGKLEKAYLDFLSRLDMLTLKGIHA